MLKKLSLIFIKFSPFIIVSILLKLFLLFITTNSQLIEVVDIVSKIILVIGLIILSFTFKFCLYHRLLLYCTLLCYILYLIYVVCSVNTFVVISIIFVLVIIIFVIIFLIIYYLKHKNERVN
jgi:hypothetical protein